MKLTRNKKVREIILPPFEDMPLEPAVRLSDPVMLAVELMLTNDRTTIAVRAGERVIGHIRLTEALNFLGLRLVDKGKKQ